MKRAILRIVGAIGLLSFALTLPGCGCWGGGWHRRHYQGDSYPGRYDGRR
jgi:hypothetical protein